MRCEGKGLLLYARSTLLATFCLLLVSGCGKDPLSKNAIEATDNLSDTESGSVATLPDEIAQSQWQAAISSITNKLSRSIVMNQSVSVEQLDELVAAGDTAELLLDQGVVNDIGLQKIVAHLPNLEHLRIRLSPISDEGAVALSSLAQLRVLNLPQSKIGSQGIKAWAMLPNLEHVRLGGSQLDDSALEALAQLPNLQSLHLIGPSITDSGLQGLSSARKLSSLYVDDCQLSDEAWQKLKNACPNLHVHLDQNHRDRLKK